MYYLYSNKELLLTNKKRKYDKLTDKINYFPYFNIKFKIVKPPVNNLERFRYLSGVGHTLTARIS